MGSEAFQRAAWPSRIGNGVSLGIVELPHMDRTRSETGDSYFFFLLVCERRWLHEGLPLGVWCQACSLLFLLTGGNDAAVNTTPIGRYTWEGGRMLRTLMADEAKDGVHGWPCNIFIYRLDQLTTRRFESSPITEKPVKKYIYTPQGVSRP